MSKSLQQVDDELAELERQMAEARQRKKMQSAAVSAPAPAPSRISPPRSKSPTPNLPTTTPSNSITAEELQRQIEELERELQQASSSAKTTTTTTTEIPTTPTPPPAPATAPPRASSPKRSTTPVKSSYSPAPVASNVPDDPIRARAQQNYSFEKPAWAIPTDQVGGDQSIISDPIQNNLKKPNTGGYERKVFDKSLEIVKGTFKRPSGDDKKPEPRLVWIVININGSKIGKIVMHLYGNCDAIVDHFLELKGLEIKRPDPNTFVVTDMTPHFYITADKTIPTKYKEEGSSPHVYGHIFEGHDIYQMMINAPADSTLYTIKQSHIYPVKKTKM